MNETVEPSSDLKILADSRVKSYQIGSLRLVAAESLFLLEDPHQREAPRITPAKVSIVESSPARKRRSPLFDDELDRGPDGFYLKRFDQLKPGNLNAA
jgi:hypothetical protein